MSLTHFAPATNMLWKYLDSVGINPEPLYKRAGINPICYWIRMQE